MGVRLTKKICEEATHEGKNGGQYVIWDDVVPGLGLRVYPSGKKSFVIIYRLRKSGPVKVKVIGRYGVLTIDTARERARKFLLQTLDGKDPFSIQDKITFGKLCELYLEQHAKPHKKSWKKDESYIERHFLPLWEKRYVYEIETKHILQWFNECSKESPIEANRALEVLNVIFKHAIKWKIIKDSPSSQINYNKEEHRERWVTPEELPRIIEAINDEERVQIRALFWLYLLTGLRKSELQQAKWEWLDEKRGTLTIPQTKTGKVYHVPLSKRAMDIITAVPKKGPCIFYSPTDHDTYIFDLQKPWDRIKKRSGIHNIRLHDLRHTVGSWLVQSGHSLPIVGKILNHSSHTSTQVYAHFAHDTLKEALDDYADKLESFAQQEFRVEKNS